jgi:hypothetical protein
MSIPSRSANGPPGRDRTRATSDGHRRLLTGFFLKEHFFRRLEEEHERALRGGASWS